MGAKSKQIELYDLHCHFGGAMPPRTIWQILTKDGQVSMSLKELTQSMTYQDDDGPYEFDKFLRKFDILNSINWNEEHILTTADASVEYLANQGLSYVEMRFSINKYLQYLHMTDAEVTSFICQHLRAAGKRHKVHIAPILSIKYESSRESQERIMRLIDDVKVCDCVVGIDLVGDESFFDADFYAPLFSEWRKAGKGLIAHVGESQSAKNVKLAIEKMKVNRVSHGIHAANDINIMKLANDNGVAFDVALTSNLKTGVIKDINKHPIKILLEHGCQVSLGTDDPVVLDTTIKHEYALAKMIGISDTDIDNMKKNAIERAFEKPHKTHA
jgi:adenosine deaminase